MATLNSSLVQSKLLIQNQLEDGFNRPLIFLTKGCSIIMTFNDKTIKEIILASKIYKTNFVDYEYLICSDAFSLKDFYTIKAAPANFKHLTGLSSSMNPIDFFYKCLSGTIKVDEVDFTNKSTIKQKIKVLSNMMNILNTEFYVQEKFEKNTVICSIATTDGNGTLGFIDKSGLHPKTLLKGNKLDPQKSQGVNLLLKKYKGDEYYEKIIIGDIATLIEKYYKIKSHLSPKLCTYIEQQIEFLNNENSSQNKILIKI